MVKKEKLKTFTGLTLWLALIFFIFAMPFVPLSLDKKMDVSFLQHVDSENALVFFGFQGCSNVCPVTLSTLSQLLTIQEDTSKWPQVIFVDIDIHSDTQQASKFAKQFHPSFIGMHLAPQEITKISAKFGLNIKQKNSQISHLGKTYLLRRIAKDWRLVKIYNAKNLSINNLNNQLFNLES